MNGKVERTGAPTISNTSLPDMIAASAGKLAGSIGRVVQQITTGFMTGTPATELTKYLQGSAIPTDKNGTLQNASAADNTQQKT